MTAQRIKGRIFALLAMMVAFVSCAVTATPALADVTGGTTAFNKYLVMDENANVPNVTFGFTITAGTAAAGDGSTLPIYAGNDKNRVTGSPSIKGVASFSTTDVTYSSVQVGDNLTLDNGHKYAKQSVGVDFSGVTYSALGIYRYIITESESNASGITNDTPDTRTLDVYVQYGGDGNLSVADYVLYEGNAKSTGFTNEYTTYDLTLEKNVAGNQGDRDKYFEFAVNISRAVEGTVYTVALTNADESPTVDGESKTNPARLTVTEDGTVTGMFYLKHGQSIVIQGLTEGTQYTITEKDYTTDGYSTTYAFDSAAAVTGMDTGNQVMGTADSIVTFTNSKSGSVPMGILLETTPYLVMGGVVVVGLVALVATRMRRAR